MMPPQVGMQAQAPAQGPGGGSPDIMAMLQQLAQTPQGQQILQQVMQQLSMQRGMGAAPSGPPQGGPPMDGPPQMPMR